MPTKRKTARIVYISIGTVVAVAVTVGLAVYVANLASNKNAQSSQRCQGHQTNHVVTIKNDKVSPLHTTAPRCDTLTITNLDNETRLMAFGKHEDHQSYDGVGEKLLNQGQSLQITLVKTGNFKFHDHTHDEVQGTFTVTSTD